MDPIILDWICAMMQKVVSFSNNIYPEWTARNGPSHRDLQCLLRVMYWSAGMKSLRYVDTRLIWGSQGYVDIYNML